MKLLAFWFAICLSANLCAQKNVFAFFEYNIKDGMTEQFVNGYARDLEWHKVQQDDWTWIGWFVINGQRRGRFIDATPNHSWNDFDEWKVDGAENAKHNKIHWAPYVMHPSGSYRVLLETQSELSKNWMTSPYLQVYSLKIKSGRAGDFEKFMSAFKKSVAYKEMILVWMKTVSGGSVSDYHLFVGLKDIEGLKQCIDLFDFKEANTEIAINYRLSVESNTSELWRYSSKLSLVGNN